MLKRRKLKVAQVVATSSLLGLFSSIGVKTGNFLFISGQTLLTTKTGKLIRGNIQEQTIEVLENLKNYPNSKLILGICDKDNDISKAHGGFFFSGRDQGLPETY